MRPIRVEISLEFSSERLANFRRNLPIVDEHGKPSCLLDQRLPRAPAGLTLGPHNPIQGSQDPPPRHRAERPEIQPQHRLIRDDILRLARLHAPHRQHRKLGRIRLAAHDALQPQHDIRGQHHGIDAPARHAPMRPPPEQRDAKRIRGREERPRPHLHLPAPKRVHMLPEHHIRHGHLIIQPRINHRLRTLPALLIRLEHQHQVPRPGRHVRRQRIRRGEEAGDVDIVPARVHDGFLHFVRNVELALRARIRQTRRFLHGEGVHVRAEEDRFPGAVAQDRRDAVAANSGVDAEVAGVARVEGFEVVAYRLRGEGFLRGEVGVGVQGFVEVFVVRAGIVGGEGEPGRFCHAVRRPCEGCVGMELPLSCS